MKIEQAIEILKCIYPSQKEIVTGEYDGVAEALDLAISALEKQIPKRPHADDNGGAEDYECWIECPLCGEAIPEYTSENETECYCLRCGQKLDWSGDDE